MSLIVRQTKYNCSVWSGSRISGWYFSLLRPMTSCEQHDNQGEIWGLTAMTTSMASSPTLEAKRCSDGQQIPCVLMNPKFTASVLELITCYDITSCSPLACHQTTRSHLEVHSTNGFKWNVLFQTDKQIRWRDIIFQVSARPQFWRRNQFLVERPTDHLILSLFAFSLGTE